MNTNEILKTLTELQKSLNEIDSAKQQVLNVVSSSAELANVIASYKTSFEGLSSSMRKVFEESNVYNLKTTTKLSEQIDVFKNEISKLMNYDFTKSSLSIEKEIIKTFEKDLLARLVILDKKINDLQVGIVEFQTQISRLEVIDLQSKFNQLDILQKKILNMMATVHKENKQNFTELNHEIKINRILQICQIVFLTLVGIISVFTIYYLVFKP